VKGSDFYGAPSRSRLGSPDPQSAEACNIRGRELIAQGKYHEAIAELSEALRQDPNFTLALNARGFAYYLVRDYKHSLADFDAAIRLNPQYDNAYLNRSKARRATGDAAGSAADSKRRKSLAKSES
jgi:tetratricopeptide (TPR) repeat protein